MSTVTVGSNTYGQIAGLSPYPTLATGWSAGQFAVLVMKGPSNRGIAGWSRFTTDGFVSGDPRLGGFATVWTRTLQAGDHTEIYPDAQSGNWPDGTPWRLLLLDNVAAGGFAGFVKAGDGRPLVPSPETIRVPSVSPGFGQQFAYVAMQNQDNESGISVATAAPWVKISGGTPPFNLYLYSPAVGVASPGPLAVLTFSSQQPIAPGGWMLAVQAQQPPNSVTVASPALNSVVNETAIVRFTASPFTDPNAGDQLSAMDLRWTQDGGITWTTIHQPAADLFVDVPAGTLTDGQVQIQMRPYDLGGNVALWGPSAFFTAGTPAPGPAVSYPVPAQTVGQFDRVDWGGAGSGYWVRVLADNAGVPADPAVPGNIYFDSGPVSGDPLTRTLPIEYSANGVAAHVQVAVLINSLWTLFTDVPVDVLWVPPPAPSAMVTAVDAGSGTITLAIAVGATAPGAPDPQSVTVSTSRDGGQSVETRQSGIAPGLTTWIHETPASGADYVYQVQTVAGDGTTSGTGWFGAA